MKKLATLLLCVALVMGTMTMFASCATKDEGDGTIVVDVFWYWFGDTFLASVRGDMIAEEARFPYLNVTHHDSNNDQSTQLDQINTAITRGTDLLVVNIVNTAAEDVAMQIVRLGEENGIPVLFFNCEVSDAVINAINNAAFIGTDAAEAGVFQGMAIANFLLAGDNASRFDRTATGKSHM